VFLSLVIILTTLIFLWIFSEETIDLLSTHGVYFFQSTNPLPR